MNIILVGIKHCGKTTLGRLLAEKNSAMFVDTDELIETNYCLAAGEKLSCREIYRRLGAEKFREMEAAALRQLAESSDEFDSERVIALGGGAAANSGIALDELRKLGHFVFIDMEPKEAYTRISAGGLPPFLADADDPEQAFYELCANRRTHYAHCADATFRPDPELEPEENLERLVELLESCK